MINDTYISRSVKDGLWRERGTAGQKVQIQGFQQRMLQGLKW